MQMIYLLHSTLDEELMGRLRRTLDRGFLGRRPEGRDVPVGNDNVVRFDVAVTDQELTDDLHFGRAA